MYEYTSQVFAVGLEGFAPVDNDKIGAMAEEGWEPTHMTTVHHGFAAVVLFRRESSGGRRPAASTASRSRVRKAAPVAAPAGGSGRGAAATKRPATAKRATAKRAATGAAKRTRG